MKSWYTIYIHCFLLILLTSCIEKDGEQKGLYLSEGYDQILDIISIADCDSPFGKYTTEVHSFKKGGCFFEQNFADSNSSFIVKVDSNQRGYILNEMEIITDTLSESDVEMIRGHEIHKMSIDPHFFFKDIDYINQASSQESGQERYRGKDRINNPVEITYDPNKKLISKIESLNPRDTSQIIEILFDKWIPSTYGDMVKEIRIIQAKKDTFYFDFVTLKIRDETGVNDVIHPKNNS